MLKQSVDQTVSFDAKIFPLLKNSVYTSIQSALVETNGLDLEVAEKEAGEKYNNGHIKYMPNTSFFTLEEIKEIKQRILDFKSSKSSGGKINRTGGAQLEKELEKIEYFKEGLLSHIQAIKDVLNPKPASRTTLAEAEALAQERAIKSVADSLKGLSEKILRGFGEQVLGDVQLDYTVEELPLAIAHKQITGQAWVRK